MELMLKISVEEEKNDLKLNVFVWSQNITNQKLNDLCSPVANFKIPLKYVPHCEIASSDPVPNDSREESKTKKPGKYAPHALQSNENENPSDRAIKTPAVSDKIEQQLQNSSNEQSVAENEDLDVSMNLPRFMEYLKEKHREIISNRNSPQGTCKCGTSFLKESELNGWIENPVEKLKEDVPVEIENSAWNGTQSETDQVTHEYDIQPAGTERQNPELKHIALADTSQKSPEMNNILPEGGNSKQSSEINSSGLDAVSVCSDDYTLLIDENQPETDVSPTKKLVDAEKLSDLVTSPKVVASTPRCKRDQFWCRLCKLSFDRESSQKSHMNSYHGLRFTCGVCDMQFAYRSQFMAHFRNHRIEKVPERDRQSCACKLCGSKFDSTKSLLVHSKLHLTKKSTYSLWQNSRLNAHNRVAKKLS